MDLFFRIEIKSWVQSSVIQWALSDKSLGTDRTESRAEDHREKPSLRFDCSQENADILLKQSNDLVQLNSCIVEAKKAVREKMKEIAQKKRDQVIQVKRMKNPRACPHCPGFPMFETGAERDNHLISSHNYDYCKLCKVRQSLGLLLNMMLFLADRTESERDASLRSLSSKTALPSLWLTVTNLREN